MLRSTLCTLVALVLGLGGAACGYELTLIDPVGDDYGPGSYSYPYDPVFTDGSFDLVRFTVEEVGSRVRFEIEIAGEIEDPWGSGAGFSLQSIDIYIDKDGVAGSGSVGSLGSRNVGFSPGSAWEYVIWCAPPFDDFETHVVDSEGVTYDSGITVDADHGSDVITIEVPEQIIGTPGPAWRFVVLMLSQAGFSPGRVRPVAGSTGQWVLGGGDDGSCDANVIDLVAESEVSQENLLANYDPVTGVQPVLINRIDSVPPVITHAPVTTWEAHVPLAVEAELEDDVVVAAALFTRASPGGFDQWNMQRLDSVNWRCLLPGSYLAEGSLEYYIHATDGTSSAALGDSSAPLVATITPDVTPPVITSLEALPGVFSPNGDAYRDSTAITAYLSEPCYVCIDVYDSLGIGVREIADGLAGESEVSAIWDGKGAAGETVEEGMYRIEASCVDLAGHAGPPESAWVEVDMDETIRTLDVILLFHANQNLVPYGRVGNIACYQGVMETLREHPACRFPLHFSGCLLSDLLWSDPATVALLREGVDQGQFEVVGSTYIQNIIYSTRSFEDDFQFNQHQTGIHRAFLEDLLGVSPVSYWNCERVWTQNIVKLLTDNGYENVQIEDHILEASGISGSEYAVRTTTYQGKAVNVFTDDKHFQGLVNGAIDSGDTAAVMGFLRDLYDQDVDDRFAVCYFEDMEASGLWDYEGGGDPAYNWANLDKLLTAMESDPRIKVTTYAEFMQDHQTLEDISPVLDGAADWMGRDAWFAENAGPTAEAYRVFFDGIRDTLNAIHSAFTAYAPDTTAARALLDHAWFTLCAHQYEFAVHGYAGIAGTTQWELARCALVGGSAARAALLGVARTSVEDINGDAIDEIVIVTETDLFVLSRYGGRLLYWFDLESGIQLVGNENFMRSYGEPYTNDNQYVPVALGTEAYPWLSGNMVIPEVHTWTFQARRRALNDWVWLDGQPAGILVDAFLDYAVDSSGVEFQYDLEGMSIVKRIEPAGHRLDVTYTFLSSAGQDLDVAIEIENGLSPDCLRVMTTGRGSLRYWDGQDTSWAVTGSMRGVLNLDSDVGLLLDMSQGPLAVTGEEDIFGLEVNPRWEFSVPPFTSHEIRLGIEMASRAAARPPLDEDRQGRVIISPNPSSGAVRLSIDSAGVSPVSARIFDLSGRRVRSLRARRKRAARTVWWDGLNDFGEQVASGVYLVRVSDGGTTFSGKVAIIR
jgi:hypothetical protein